MPAREKFPLNSEYCEMLFTFSQSEGIEGFAEHHGIDLKAAAKKLESIREKAPAVEKVGSEWVLTPLGLMLSKWTGEAMASQSKILRQEGNLRLSPNELDPFTGNGALVLVGVQKGFEDPIWGQRNNPEAAQRIQVLLNYWRDRNLPVYHVQHVSNNPLSPSWTLFTRERMRRLLKKPATPLLSVLTSKKL